LFLDHLLGTPQEAGFKIITDKIDQPGSQVILAIKNGSVANN
jgi:hypothetical protein